MPNPAQHLLQHYLAQLRARGTTHVTLDKDAVSALRHVGKPAAPAAAPETRSRSSAMPSNVAIRPEVRPTTTPAIVPPTRPEREIPAEKTWAASVVSESAKASAPKAIAMVTAEKEAELKKLALQAENCEAARNTGTLRDIMVFATGSPDADIMFVGEAPGAEEEKLREPFVGPAGQLLTKIIQAMGLRRSDVYISNICKFRPKIEDGRPQNNRNRAPTPGEMLTCAPFITAEINIIRPKVLVALGATASTGLGIEGTVGKLRGKFQDFRGIPVMVTYHPSYLLRREQEDGGGLAEKRLVWEDMMQVMEMAGLAVSAKQRAYFSKPKA